MKVLFAILVLLFFSPAAFCQFLSAENVLVGNVDCHRKETYLDSTKFAYGSSYINEDIHNSKYLIDIDLTSNDVFPGLEIIVSRLSWDTCFKLYYITYKREYNAGAEVYVPRDTMYASSSIADSVFSKLVNAGIFSLPLISTENLIHSARSFYLSKQGEFSDNWIRVSDGVQYGLTYKVNNCYGQHFFSNPDEYLKCYVDNAIFKQQAAIAEAFMGPYYLQHK